MRGDRLSDRPPAIGIQLGVLSLRGVTMEFNVHRRVLAVLFSTLLPIAPALAAQSETGLKIVVQEGSGTSAIILRPVPRPLIVRVVDSRNQPVRGATVVFTSPTTGPSGLFVNGSNSIIVFTNQQGIATAQEYRANSTEGSYHIQVQAAYMGDHATLPVEQTNVVPRKSPGRAIAIALAAGGALGAVLATRGGNDSSNKGSPSTNQGGPPTITLLGSTVGGTR